MDYKNYLKQIFKKGSNTFYHASHFFDSEKKDDVYKLYAFMRVIDDFIDSSPQKKT